MPDQALDVEPLASRSPEDRGEAAPSPIVCLVAKAGLDRVAGDVCRDGPEMLRGQDPHRPEAALENVPDSVMAVVELSGVVPMKPLHPRAQVRLGRLDEE